MFKVNNQNTRTTSMASFWSFYCYFWTYFPPFSNVSIDNFEQVTNVAHVTNNQFVTNDLHYPWSCLSPLFITSQTIVEVLLIHTVIYIHIFFFMLPLTIFKSFRNTTHTKRGASFLTSYRVWTVLSASSNCFCYQRRRRRNISPFTPNCDGLPIQRRIFSSVNCKLAFSCSN